MIRRALYQRIHQKELVTVCLILKLYDDDIPTTAVKMEDVEADSAMCNVHHVMDTAECKMRIHPAFAIIQQLTVNMSTSLEKKMEELMLDETKTMDAVLKDNYKVFAFAKLSSLRT